MTDSRNSIYRAVVEVPGIHFNGLVDRLGLAPGQVQHHLRRLRSDGRIVKQPLYGRTHYFPPGYEVSEQRKLALCHRETARDILLHLLESGPSAPNSVVDSLGIARGTLEWHLDHLVEQGLVEKQRDEQTRIELTLANPDETVRLLGDIEPALSDRLVDRFTRLVDQFLSD